MSHYNGTIEVGSDSTQVPMYAHVRKRPLNHVLHVIMPRPWATSLNGGSWRECALPEGDKVEVVFVSDVVDDGRVAEVCFLPLGVVQPHRVVVRLARHLAIGLLP